MLNFSNLFSMLYNCLHISNSQLSKNNINSIMYLRLYMLKILREDLYHVDHRFSSSDLLLIFFSIPVMRSLPSTVCWDLVQTLWWGQALQPAWRWCLFSQNSWVIPNHPKTTWKIEKGKKKKRRKEKRRTRRGRRRKKGVGVFHSFMLFPFHISNRWRKPKHK